MHSLKRLWLILFIGCASNWKPATLELEDGSVLKGGNEEQVSIILNESEQGTFNWCMASGGKDLTPSYNSLLYTSDAADE